MLDRRQLLLKAALFGLGAAGMARIPAANASTQSPDGLLHQDWFHKTSFDLKKDSAAATKADKSLVLVWEQRGCHYCQKMHEFVFQDPEFEDYAKDRFLIIQMNLWGEREFKDFYDQTLTEEKLARNLLVRGTPNVLFFDDVNDVTFRIPGYADPPIFKSVFRYVHEKGYNGMNFQNWFEANHKG